MYLADSMAVVPPHTRPARPREDIIIDIINHIIIVGIVLSRDVQSRECDYEENDGPHTVEE